MGNDDRISGNFGIKELCGTLVPIFSFKNYKNLEHRCEISAENKNGVQNLYQFLYTRWRQMILLKNSYIPHWTGTEHFLHNLSEFEHFTSQCYPNVGPLIYHNFPLIVYNGMFFSYYVLVFISFVRGWRDDTLTRRKISLKIISYIEENTCMVCWRTIWGKITNHWQIFRTI